MTEKIITTEEEHPKKIKVEPGIYYNIPFQEYKQWDAFNQSSLRELQRSPMHMLHDVNNPSEPTDAMIWGAAIHAAILEPEKFKAEYVPSPMCEGVKKDNERCINDAKGKFGKHWLCGVHSKGLKSETQEIIISPEKYKACETLNKLVKEHKIARKFFENEHFVEVSIVWIDPIFGIKCKGRLDLLSSYFNAIVDIKSVDNASKEAFSRHMLDFGYHQQAPFYCDGLSALAINIDLFIFVVVEKTPPYGIALYGLNNKTNEADDAMHPGRFEIKRLMGIYSKCLEQNSYPGYPEEIEKIQIPDYAKKKIYQ